MGGKVFFGIIGGGGSGADGTRTAGNAGSPGQWNNGWWPVDPGGVIEASPGAGGTAPAKEANGFDGQATAVQYGDKRVAALGGKRLRENTDDWITWSTGNQGNTQLVHLSFVTFSANTRQQWLAQETMLRAGASVVAHWCKKYGWPAQFKEVNQLPGVTRHAVTRAWGGTDHTDPGKNFPWDVFLRYVQEAMNPPKPQPKPEPIPLPKENDMTPEQDRIMRENNQMLKLVLAQLGGPKDFNGWPQGGGRTQYDLTAAVAEKLGVVGTRDMKGKN